MFKFLADTWSSTSERLSNIWPVRAEVASSEFINLPLVVHTPAAEVEFLSAPVVSYKKIPVNPAILSFYETVLKFHIEKTNELIKVRNKILNTDCQFASDWSCDTIIRFISLSTQARDASKIALERNNTLCTAGNQWISAQLQGEPENDCYGIVRQGHASVEGIKKTYLACQLYLYYANGILESPPTLDSTLQKIRHQFSAIDSMTIQELEAALSKDLEEGKTHSLRIVK